MREFLGVALLYLLARGERILPRSLHLQCWAWLGCYQTALQSLRSETARTPTAIRAFAACGAKAEAEKRAFLLSPRRRRKTAAAVAAFHPQLAAKLLPSSASTAPEAAILAVAGRHEAARAVLRKLSPTRTRQPQTVLLRANCRLQLPVDALNECFRHARLAEVEATGPWPGCFAITPRAPLTAINGPLVSIIIPARNTEAFVGAALESVCRQTWSNLEILVVDDASTDGTGAILHHLSRQDSRIKLLTHDRQAGPYAARMTALSRAKGEFVTCHDSDDWAHPQRIERQMAPLIRHRRLVATVSDWVRVSNEGDFYVRKSWPLIHHNPASVMFRKNPVIDRMGGFDLVRAGADSEFYERLKLVFGPLAVQRTNGILSIGSHRAGSLMNDPEIGVIDHALSPSRLAYWEAWRHWHVESLRAGRRLFMPAGGPRPFEAPAELLIT